MSKPTYHSIRKSDTEEIEFDRGKIRILTGNYKSYQGYKGDHLPLNYYDIHMYENAEITLDTLEDTSVMIFTLIGDVYVGGERIKEKTAADIFAQVLFIESKALNEPVAWAGPIVMNTQEEIREAYIDLHNATFIKDNIRY